MLSKAVCRWRYGVVTIIRKYFTISCKNINYIHKKLKLLTVCFYQQYINVNPALYVTRSLLLICVNLSNSMQKWASELPAKTLSILYTPMTESERRFQYERAGGILSSDDHVSAGLGTKYQSFDGKTKTLLFLVVLHQD